MSFDKAAEVGCCEAWAALIQSVCSSTSAVGTHGEPEFMTVPELAAWLRLDVMGVKDPERWIKGRLMPSHPEYLPHHRFTRNQPVFSRGDREEICRRYSRGQRSSTGSDGYRDHDLAVRPADARDIARGARTLEITGRLQPDDR